MVSGSDRDARRRARIEAERARRRRARRRPHGPRRALVAGVIGGVIALGVAGALVALRTSDEGNATEDERVPIGREGSSVVEGASAVEITRAPEAYSVTYRVETGGSSLTIVTDEVTTRRPWESRLDTREGPPPGGDDVSARVGWFLRTATVASADPLVIEVPPAAPPTDLRLERVLPVAVERAVIERREARRVAGRLCQVYRSRRTLAAPITSATADEFVDTCVDEAGLVLEEVVSDHGDILTRRVATEVSENPTLTDGDFRVEGQPAPARSGGGSVRKVKAGSMPPGQFFVADNGPAGFEYVGRFSVVPVQPENFGDDPTREPYRRAGIVDAWRRGIDIVAIDQGGTLGGADAFAPSEEALAIDLPPFGGGELLLSGTGTEIRVKRDGGRYLRVYGTVSPDDLVALASSLRAVEGGTLEFEDS